MKLQNVGKNPYFFGAKVGKVRPGGTVELPEAQASHLMATGDWVQVVAEKPAPSKPKTAAVKPADSTPEVEPAKTDQK